MCCFKVLALLNRGIVILFVLLLGLGTESKADNPQKPANSAGCDALVSADIPRLITEATHPRPEDLKDAALTFKKLTGQIAQPAEATYIYVHVYLDKIFELAKTVAFLDQTWLKTMIFLTALREAEGHVLVSLLFYKFSQNPLPHDTDNRYLSQQINDRILSVHSVLNYTTDETVRNALVSYFLLQPTPPDVAGINHFRTRSGSITSNLVAHVFDDYLERSRTGSQRPLNLFNEASPFAFSSTLEIFEELETFPMVAILTYVNRVYHDISPNFANHPQVELMKKFIEDTQNVNHLFFRTSVGPPSPPNLR